MRFSTLILIGSLLISTQGLSQLNLIKEIKTDSLANVSVDRLGNFYFILNNGIVQKFDLNGELLEETSSHYDNITLIEPWNPLNVFLYNAPEQKIDYLDHHLKPLNSTSLEPSLSVNPRLVCPDNQVNKVWIYDQADQSIKKVDLPSSSILIDMLLPTDWIDENSQIVFMREYQNMLFLLDRQKGILILNSLGIPITTIDVQGLSFFNFNVEELCYRKNESVILFDLHTGNSRVIATLQDSKNIRFTVITDERLLVVRTQSSEIYDLEID